jgi:hypothetical protein
LQDIASGRALFFELLSTAMSIIIKEVLPSRRCESETSRHSMRPAVLRAQTNTTLAFQLQKRAKAWTEHIEIDN